MGAWVAGPSQFKVFLAAPSDVASDVETVKRCIEDVNLLAMPLGLRFQPFYWTDDAVPGIDVEPQALINEQAEGFDALVAIFGSKLGYPTAGHPSGTVEEIERAIEALPSLTFGKHSVMIFFRSVKLDTRTADLQAAAKVQEFRTSLGPRGVLFKDFEDEDSLREAVLRSFGVLIASRIRASANAVSVPRIASSRQAADDSTTAQPVTMDEHEEDELGIMDLELIAQEHMAEANQGANRVAEIISELGDRVSEFAEEVTRLNALGDRAGTRRVINESAEVMASSAVELNVNSDSLRVSYKDAFKAMETLLDIQSVDMGDSIGDENRKELFETVSSITDTISNTIVQIANFHESVATIPRMTKELNKAKKDLLSATEKLIANLEDVRTENGSFLSRMQPRSSDPT